jgi:acyl carrier protein
MKPELTWESYLQRVSAFLGREPVSLSRTTHLFDELCIDSLGIFSLGMHLIDAFKIRVPLSEVSAIATVGDLFESMARHRDDSFL